MHNNRRRNSRPLLNDVNHNCGRCARTCKVRQLLYHTSPTLTQLTQETSRATALFQVMTGGYVAQMTATTLSSALMETHEPWLPIGLGYICGILATLMVLLLPETSSQHNTAKDNMTIEGATTPIPTQTATADVRSSPDATLGSNSLQSLSHHSGEKQRYFSAMTSN